MSVGTDNDRTPRLRRDLASVVVTGDGRGRRIVIDEIAGRFTRVSAHVWSALRDGRGAASLWGQASAAGWTCDREAAQRRRFSPWCVRLPCGPVDRVAKPLAERAGWLFGPTAIAVWTMFVVVSAATLLSRWGLASASLGSLRRFLAEVNPIWVGAIFLATKAVHELGHAVTCRRVGAKPGFVGVLLLCGIPCPYCDVSDVWRHRSRWARGAVMAAGIYLELIIASVAVWVWMLAAEPGARLWAIHVITVCGVSTLLFNANPLVRYDGYHLLADLIDSVSLRREASDAFRGVVTRRLAGRRYEIPIRRDRRGLGLACYHAASVAYRVMIGVAIAGLIVSWASASGLATVARWMVAAGVVVAVAASWKRAAHVLGGSGPWGQVPVPRRVLVGAVGPLAIAAVLFVPVPRYRSETGRVDAADAVAVFVTRGGRVEEVGHDFGDRVVAGESLARVADDEDALEVARLEGEVRLASLRSRVVRESLAEGDETGARWRTLRAAEEAALTRSRLARRRRGECNLTAPVDGMLIPHFGPGPSGAGSSFSSRSRPDPLATSVGSGESRDSTSHRSRGAADIRSAGGSSLRDRVGQVATEKSAWCRVAEGSRLVAVIRIDARDRGRIEVGTPVMIRLRQSPGEAIVSRVRSVSAVAADATSVTRRAAYRVLCELPSAAANWEKAVPPAGVNRAGETRTEGDADGEARAGEFLSRIGGSCDAVFRFPPRPLVTDLWERIGEWLRT